MKKILFIAVLGLIAGGAYAAQDVSSINRGNSPSHTSLVRHMTGVRTETTGTEYNLGALYTNHVWEINVAGGTPSGFNAKLEGSIDGATWYTMDSYSTVTPEDRMGWVVDHPVDMVRVRLVNYTSVGTVTITSKHGGN